MEPEPNSVDIRQRRQDVEGILLELGWADPEVLSEWDGEDLDFLRGFLGDEQFQTLLDELDMEYMED